MTLYDTFIQVLRELLSPYIFLIIGMILFVLYVLVCVYLYLAQDSLIFFPTKPYTGVLEKGIEKLYYEKDDVRLSGFIRRGEGPTFFYFGGNASEAYKGIRSMKQKGTIISFNYRGYGESGGRPSEKNFFDDAIALYDWLEKEGYLKQNDTILYGKSLGTGVASYLSSVRPSRGIILVTPYDSLVNVAQAKYPIIPVKYLLRHHFDSEKYITSYKNPILIVYAGNDVVIPNKHTKNLISQLGNNLKVVYIEKATHDDIVDYPECQKSIVTFAENHPGNK